mgnify:CR=1 FL=1
MPSVLKNFHEQGLAQFGQLFLALRENSSWQIYECTHPQIIKKEISDIAQFVQNLSTSCQNNIFYSVYFLLFYSWSTAK